jgi:hypothetical protein
MARGEIVVPWLMVRRNIFVAVQYHKIVMCRSRSQILPKNEA